MPFHHPAPVRVKTTVKLVAIRVTGIVFAGHEPFCCQPRGFYGIVLWRFTLEITAWVWGGGDKMKGSWRGWRERHVGAAAGRGGQFVFVPANSRFPPPPLLPPFCTHADDLKNCKPPLIEIAVLLCSRVGADDRVEEERKGGTVGSNACVRVRWDGRKDGGDRKWEGWYLWIFKPWDQLPPHRPLFLFFIFLLSRLCIPWRPWPSLCALLRQNGGEGGADGWRREWT